jgi:hypothetical protein
MKLCLLLGLIISFGSLAQDPKSYFDQFDNRLYSLKTKGVKEFVVDVRSSKLTKLMNDQMTFGKVDDLYFRIYWTASPLRIAAEVMGLPEGFKEVKDELKVSILSTMDNLVPIPLNDRFASYKISTGAQPKEFVAIDQTGLAPVPSYLLKFDKQDRLAEIQGKKPVGTLDVKLSYDKESFSDGKWVLKSQVSETSESGQTLKSRKVFIYGQSSGLGVVTRVDATTEQSWAHENMKPLIVEESLEYRNYQINTGEALKYFLGESSNRREQVIP